MFRVFTANIRHNRPLTKMSASTLWLFYLLHTDATRPQVSEWQLFEWPTKAEKFPTFHFPSQPPPPPIWGFGLGSPEIVKSWRRKPREQQRQREMRKLAFRVTVMG